MKSKLICFMIVFSAAVNAFEFESRPFKKRTSAGQCKTVDLRGPKLGPVRNQDTVGWCFAYAAADIVSYHLGQKVSAADMAMNFYHNMPEMHDGLKLSEVGGGPGTGPISASHKSGYCLESELASEDLSFAEACGPNGDKTEILNTIQKIERFNIERPDSISRCELGAIPSMFKNLSAEEIVKIVRQAGISPLQTMKNLQAANCKNRIKPPKLFKNKSEAGPGHTLFATLDQQLDKQNPLVVDYEAGMLISDKPGAESYRHVSVVVGRKFDSSTNTCKYLIRNSWGRSCSGYPEKYKQQCEEGHIWMDEETFAKSLIEITWIQP